MHNWCVFLSKYHSNKVTKWKITHYKSFIQKIGIFEEHVNEEKGIVKNNVFLEAKTKGEKIFFSELLADPPSDEILVELFPYGRKNALFITQTALKVLNLKLNGLNVEEIGEKLNLTRSQVYGRLQNVEVKLVQGPIPDYIELDIPVLRKMCGMDVPVAGGYMKVSELLQDMPSEQELLEFAASRGNVPGFSNTRPINRGDLLLLQKKAAGRQNVDIARELGVSRGSIHQRLAWIHRVLKSIGVQIDMPELFPYE